MSSKALQMTLLSSDQKKISQGINQLVIDAKEDAYKLSIPLLITAQSGDTATYHIILPKMNEALSHISSDQSSLKAWLLGRVLLASQSIHDDATQKATYHALSQLLHNPKIKDDAYLAWAWGYFAASDKTTYQKSKKAMLAIANQLTQNYGIAVKDSTKLSRSLQEKRSNTIWVWVMIANAAANAGDKATYQEAVQMIPSMMGQKTLSEAILKGLERTHENNDYPAWAMAIVSLAAATMKDEKNYIELKKVLPTSIVSAEKSNAFGEALLSNINFDLALQQELA